MLINLTQNEKLADFYERLLFTVFVECFIIKDTKIFNYTLPKTLKQNEKFPIQITSLIDKYAKGEILEPNQSDVQNFFLLYMNYKHLFQIEYFEDTLQKWFLLDKNKVANMTEKLLCRITPYINEELDILKKEDMQFTLVNQHFILST